MEKEGLTELEKRKLGMWYDNNFDPQLTAARDATFDLCLELNQVPIREGEKRKALLEKLIGDVPDDLELKGPFTCEVGKNITFGHGDYINCYAYFMDYAPITLGDKVFMGPNCGLYTAIHPMIYKYRNIGLEKALPITVGDNCWFGGNVTVLPGVIIGSGCVIGAGSVVTKDIPDNSFAAGVPAKVIRTIDQDAELED